MPGTPGRSGRPKRDKKQSKGDGNPESPHILSKSAKKHYAWLLERLGTSLDGSPWRRLDGVTLANLAEQMESLEHLARALEANPLDDKLLRMRLNYADRIYKYSGIIGLTPRDRERLPQATDRDTDSADEWAAE